MKWGILGTSFISGVMAEAIQGDDKSELYAVAGRSEQNLKTFAEQYGIENTFNDYDALIADEQVDIIYIALPNHLHHDFIVKAAEQGKAILCEKSLSVDMEKTELALKAVETHKVFFAEGLMYLHHPLITQYPSSPLHTPFISNHIFPLSSSLHTITPFSAPSSSTPHHFFIHVYASASPASSPSSSIYTITPPYLPLFTSLLFVLHTHTHTHTHAHNPQTPPL